jgi:hypothetical protein
MVTQRKPPHFMDGTNTPDALAHYIRAKLTMPRRANDDYKAMKNPNTPPIEG